MPSAFFCPTSTIEIHLPLPAPMSVGKETNEVYEFGGPSAWNRTSNFSCAETNRFR